MLCTLYFGFVPESCTKVIAFLFKRQWREKSSAFFYIGGKKISKRDTTDLGKDV